MQDKGDTFMTGTVKEKRAKLLRTAIYAVALLSAAVITATSSQVSASVTSAMTLCAHSLIPTVFPFLVLNGILIKCGFAESIGKLIGTPIAFLFGINVNLAASLVTGLLCGFPTGAAAANGIAEAGLCREDDTERAAICSSFASPGFMIAGVGISMLGSASVGIALWMFQAAAVVCTGIVLNLVFPRNLSVSGYSPKFPSVSSLSAISGAVKDAAETMLGVCGSVIFFSVFSGFILSLGLLPVTIRCIIACFFELTSGTAAAAKMLSPNTAVIVSAWAAGWAGLSVHAQTSLVTDGRASGRYIAGKALSSLLSALFAAMALKFGVI